MKFILKIRIDFEFSEILKLILDIINNKDI